MVEPTPGPSSAPSPTPPPGYDIRISGGDPTDEEIAAVTAVLSAALEELSADDGRRRRLTPTAWERSQRSVRTPLTPGAWKTFGL